MSDLPSEDIDVATDAPGDVQPRDPLVLAVIGLVAAVVLFLAAAIPVLHDRGSGSTADTEPTTTPVDTAAATMPETTAPTAATTPETTAPNADTGEAPATTESTITTMTTTTTTLAIEPVPESIAVVEGGKIYLSGAVPDQTSMMRIVQLAGDVLGPENVINDYTIDPGASDPNLGNIRVDDHILFESGTARIAPEFEPLLNQALALMTIRPSVTMHIVGHTDDRGSLEDNQDLSERRADAVVTWLVDRGVEPDRLTSEGRGELEPIATNATPEGQTLNRRIQVFIANLLADEA